MTRWLSTWRPNSGSLESLKSDARTEGFSLDFAAKRSFGRFAGDWGSTDAKVSAEAFHNASSAEAFNKARKSGGYSSFAATDCCI